MKLVSLLGYVLMAAGVVGLVLLHNILSPAPVVIGLQAAAVALMAWARLSFGRRSFHAGADPTRGELVTNGPYRFVRHPIYAAVLLFVFAGVSVHLSLPAAGLTLAIVCDALGRILAEERFLRAHYQEYAEYAMRTKRLVPYLF